MKAALTAALIELERQFAKRTPVIRIIVNPDGTEHSRIVRGTCNPEQETSE